MNEPNPENNSSEEPTSEVDSLSESEVDLVEEILADKNTLTLLDMEEMAKTYVRRGGSTDEINDLLTKIAKCSLDYDEVKVPKGGVLDIEGKTPAEVKGALREHVEDMLREKMKTLKAAKDQEGKKDQESSESQPVKNTKEIRSENQTAQDAVDSENDSHEGNPADHRSGQEESIEPSLGMAELADELGADAGFPENMPEEVAGDYSRIPDTLQELYKMWDQDHELLAEKRDDESSDFTSEDLYQWQNTLYFHIEKISRQHVLNYSQQSDEEALTDVWDKLHKLQDTIPFFFDINEDIETLLSAETPEELKEKRENLVQKYQELNQAVQKVSRWREQGLAIPAEYLGGKATGGQRYRFDFIQIADRKVQLRGNDKHDALQVCLEKMRNIGERYRDDVKKRRMQEIKQEKEKLEDQPVGPVEVPGVNPEKVYADEVPQPVIERFQRAVEQHDSILIDNFNDSESISQVICENLKITTNSAGQRLLSFRPVYRKRAFKGGEDTLQEEAGNRQEVYVARLADYTFGQKEKLPATLGIDKGEVIFLDENQDENPDEKRYQDLRGDTLQFSQIKDVIKDGLINDKDKENIYRQLWQKFQKNSELVLPSGRRWVRTYDEPKKDGSPQPKLELEDENGNRVGGSFQQNRESFERFIDNHFREYIDSLQKFEDAIKRQHPLDQDYADQLSSSVKKEISGRAVRLYDAYIYKLRELRAAQQADGIEVSDTLHKAFDASKDDSLISGVADLSRRVFNKASNKADMRAFLDIAPDEFDDSILEKQRQKAAKVVKDEAFRQKFFTARQIKARLLERKSEIEDKTGEDYNEGEMQRIDSLLEKLNPNSGEFLAQARQFLEDSDAQQDNGEKSADTSTETKDKEKSGAEKTDSTEGREKKEHEDISEGDIVKLHDQGSPRWKNSYPVEDIQEMNGEKHIKTSKDEAYRPAEKFQLQPAMTAEDIDDYLDRSNLLEVVGSAGSVEDAVDSLMEHDGIFVREDPNKSNLIKQSDGTWSRITEIGGQKQETKVYSEDEARANIAELVENSEAFRMKDYLQSTQDLLDKIIGRYPDEEKVDNQDAKEYLVALQDVKSHVTGMLADLKEGNIHNDAYEKIQFWMTEGVRNDFDTITDYMERDTYNTDTLQEALDDLADKREKLERVRPGNV